MEDLTVAFKALRVAHMRHMTFSAATADQLVDACVRAGAAMQAIPWLQRGGRMRLFPRHSAWERLIAALGSEGRTDDVAAALRAMQRRQPDPWGAMAPRPRAKTFHMVIKAFVDAGDTATALKYVQTAMHALDGAQPRRPLVTPVLAALAEAAGSMDAEERSGWQAALALAAPHFAEDKGAQPSTCDAFTRALGALEAAAASEGAAEEAPAEGEDAGEGEQGA